jgi:amphi-Trp domain-containing protein
MAKSKSKAERRAEKRILKLTRQEARLARRIERREERVTVQHEAPLGRAEAVALVDRILAGVRSGSIVVEEGDERLDLMPGLDITARVRARRTHKGEEITIRLRWPRADVERPRSALRTGAEPTDG